MCFGTRLYDYLTKEAYSLLNFYEEALKDKSMLRYLVYIKFGNNATVLNKRSIQISQYSKAIDFLTAEIVESIFIFFK